MEIAREVNSWFEEGEGGARRAEGARRIGGRVVDAEKEEALRRLKRRSFLSLDEDEDEDEDDYEDDEDFDEDFEDFEDFDEDLDDPPPSFGSWRGLTKTPSKVSGK